MNKLQLWQEKGLTLTDRLNTKTVPQREGVSQEVLEKKKERGDISQALRLQFYPSIKVDFDRLYAGSISGSLDDAEDKLFEIGFRNGVFGYVEVTEDFGPDEGSFWLNIIRETGQFPNLPINNFLGFRRIKDQIHVAIFRDEQRDMVHFLAHREQSAALQPLRHLTINDASARRGIRDFRDVWKDTFGEEIRRPIR